MTINDLVGFYKVEGKNQDKEGSQYKGILELKLDDNHKIDAEWTIGENQKQYGKGFFKNNILVINFFYYSLDLEQFNGTVVYHFLTKNILDGFWSEEYANQKYLGEERCFKLKD